LRILFPPMSMIDFDEGKKKLSTGNEVLTEKNVFFRKRAAVF